jgi:hypothetical protein
VWNFTITRLKRSEIFPFYTENEFGVADGHLDESPDSPSEAEDEEDYQELEQDDDEGEDEEDEEDEDEEGSDMEGDDDDLYQDGDNALASGQDPDDFFFHLEEMDMGLGGKRFFFFF